MSILGTNFSLEQTVYREAMQNVIILRVHGGRAKRAGRDLAS